MAVSEDIDIKQENANVESLEEFVFDQDLVVTYKKLSKLLNVHVNKAKRLLSLFVEKARKGKRPISVTYLVSGKEVIEDNIETWRVCVVPEDHFDSTKQKFLPEGLSHHVYSVHQGTKVVDTAALISASKSGDSQTSVAAIENKNAKPRDQDKMQQLMKQAAAASTATVKQEPKASTSKPISTKPAAAPVIKKETEIKEEIKEEEPVAKKPLTINGMFAAQNSKTSDTNGKAAPKTTSNKGGKKGNSGGNIATFFQRQNSAPKKPAPVTKSETSVSEQTDSQSSTPSQSEPAPVKKELSPVTENKTKKTPVNSKSKSKQNSKKRKSKDDTEAPKKRKRIMAVSDSESSDNESEVDMMEDDTPPPPVGLIVESEEEEEQVKEATEANAASSSVTIKEKKLVDKIYKDEKGFIVTKKEWVVETRTEEVEVEEVKTSSVKTETVEVKPAAAKRKQQTDLMSFFGRKTK